MDVTDFKQNCLNGLLDKISKEEKNIFLLGDFNINLLNCNEHRPANDFLDSLASSSLLPSILKWTRLTGHSKTLIDDIFCNLTSYEVISGHITTTISYHLRQFLIAPMYLLIQTSLLLLKKTGQLLIKKILFLITSLLIGKPF